MLNSCGFNAGSEDGLWGRKTASAAAKFVSAHGGTPSSDKSSLMAQVDGHRIGDAGPCPGDTAAVAEEPEPRPETGTGRDVEKAQQILDAASDDDPPDLRGLDLAGGDFSGRSFRGGKLNNTDLTDTNMSKTDLSNTDMTGAKPKRTNFRFAKFDGSKLDNLDARDSIMTGVSLAGASIRGLRWSAATNLTLTQLAAAQVSVAHWVKALTEENISNITERFQNATDKIISGGDKLLPISVEDDGSFRLGAPKYFKDE